MIHLSLPCAGLRLEITSQCPNECRRSLERSPYGNINVIPSNTTTSYKIYRDNNHPSYLLLPTIPYTDPEQWVQPFESSCEIEVEDE